MWIGRHGRDPKTPSGIKFDSHWISKLRKFFFGGEEFDLKPLGNLELGSFFYGRKCRRYTSSFAWASCRDLDSGRIIDLRGKLIAACGAPDPLITKTGHLEKFFALERKVYCAVWVFTVTVNIEAIYGSIPIKESIIFFQHLGSNRFKRRSIR